MANETKRERFVRIAEARTNKILEMMRLLGNCSSKGNYEYSEEDIKKIFGALVRELKNTKIGGGCQYFVFFCYLLLIEK